MSKGSILIADDKRDVIMALEALLRSRGFTTFSAQTPADVIRLVQCKAFDAVLLDLNYSRDTTSGQEGLSLLSEMQNLVPHLPVVVMTAFANMEIALDAMRKGARDFIEKPWDNERLVAILQNQIALGQALDQVDNLKTENRRLSGADKIDFVATSKAMQPVLDLIARIAKTDTNVMITGEHGTGKGVIARLIHAQSDFSSNTMVSVNIGAIPDNLFESELFGHVKGAFTDAKSSRDGRFKLANNGTIFLDEIGNLSMGMQAKLLRVIETGEYEAVGSSLTEHTSARLISATNAVLSELCGSGQFREDLLFRLNTIEIKLPPLREREEDIVALANNFLQTYGQKYNRLALTFSADCLAMMQVYPWPGNVREMDHCIQRAVLMANGEQITPTELGLTAKSNSVSHDYENMTLEQVEQLLIEKAMTSCNGNMKKTAEKLGIARSSLYRRIEKFGLEVNR
jgi:DNA-binding NtrC family response regulator